MRYVKIILAAWLVGFMVAYGLSFIPPRGEILDNILPPHDMGGKWELTVNSTPWHGINACKWEWWVDDETPTNIERSFLVRGSTAAKVEGRASYYGLVLGGFRPWISAVGWGAFFLWLITFGLLRQNRVKPGRELSSSQRRAQSPWRDSRRQSVARIRQKRAVVKAVNQIPIDD